MRSQWRARIEQERRNQRYYVDENYPQYLSGFICINTSGALLTMETENYQIAQGVILDAYGKMVVEECEKFDEKTK